MQDNIEGPGLRLPTIGIVVGFVCAKLLGLVLHEYGRRLLGFLYGKDVF